MLNGHEPVKAIAYTRISTDLTRQDCDNQINELKHYCEAMQWVYDVVSEEDSAYKGTQPKLQAIVEQIRQKKYDVLLVYSLDRFSRQHPSKVNRLLDIITEQYHCRFLSLQEHLDSENEILWQCIRPVFSWFAHVYSRNLSEKIRLGIRTKKAKGLYKGGRPSKQIDVERLKTIWHQYPHLGWRLKNEKFNEGLDHKHRISTSLFRKVCRQLSFGNGHGVQANGVAQNSR